MGSLPISISIVALNEEANLPRCLESVRGLAEEIVIVDAGSTDSTPDIAKEHGARFIHQDWLGYRDQKNVALEACTSEWVLALDCDEELSAEMRSSIEEFFKKATISATWEPGLTGRSGFLAGGSPMAIGIQTGSCDCSGARVLAGAAARSTTRSRSKVPPPD